MSSFCNYKSYSHFFSKSTCVEKIKNCKSYSHFFSKNTCEFDIVLTRTVNILTTNELVKVTMLWTTGPWMILWICTFCACSKALFCFMQPRFLYPLGQAVGLAPVTQAVVVASLVAWVENLVLRRQGLTCLVQHRHLDLLRRAVSSVCAIYCYELHVLDSSKF